MLNKFYQHPWTLPVLVFLIGIVTLFGYRPDIQPLRGDRAYLVYMAQGIQRGEPIYETTTFTYAPFAPMISALVMLVGEMFSISNYLAPHLVSVPLFAFSGVLLYFITHEITQNRWLAFWAGILNFSFIHVNTTNTTNLEPKLLVQLFVLLMIVAIQNRRWFWVGIATSFAVMCWQPAAVFAFIPIIFTVNLWRQGQRLPLRDIILGGLIGCIPVLLYLTLTQQLDDFYAQGIYFKFVGSDNGQSTEQSIWLKNVVLSNLDGWRIALLPLTLLGIGYYFNPFRQADKQELEQLEIINIRSGGLFLGCLLMVFIREHFKYCQFRSAGSGRLPRIAFYDCILECRGTVVCL